MTKKELEQFLYDNFFDSFTRSINLSGLDFKRFNCGINISHMKVSAYLYQNNQEANFINQSECKAHSRIYQSKCESVVIEQNNHRAIEVEQVGHTAQYIDQTGQKAMEILQDDLDQEFEDEEE